MRLDVSSARATAAFLLAPAVPSCVNALFALEDPRTPNILRAALSISYVYTVAFGVPAYFWLRRRMPLTLLRTTIAAFCVAFVPALALSLALPNPDLASIGGVPIVVDGSRTAAGYGYLLSLSSALGVWGAATGVVWWLIARARAPRLQRG